MSQPITSRQASPIQRLVIFHLNLAEICLNGRCLDESASLDELGEQILYYHRDKKYNVRETDCADNPNNRIKDEPNNSLQEAIQFIGLCTALYSLPASVGENDIESDETKEVYFGESTLIFVPLESTTEILAVAQISRLYLRGSRNQAGGGNPLAVRHSIQRFHRLFCLMRGGGVRRRLSGDDWMDRTKTVPGHGNKCPYPGMEKLYNLRKELRRLKQKASRHSDDQADQEKRMNEEESLECQISSLQKSLPIQALRRDLCEHYNEYLGELSIISSHVGGASRCLVETVPAPIALPSELHVSQCAPSVYSTYTAINLGLAMRQLLTDFSESSNHGVHAFGVSTFVNGQILFTHTSDTPLHFDRIRNVTDGHAVSVSNETACLIMGYMASYRSKMNHDSGPSRTKSPNRVSSQPRLGLQRLTLTFGTSPEEATPYNNELKDPFSDDQFFNSGAYLGPPPLFMLSASDRTHCFDRENKQKVWAPLVHLPVDLTHESKTETLSVDAHVILYETRSFSFLIYLYPQQGSSFRDLQTPGMSSCDSSASTECRSPSTASHDLFLEQLSKHLSDAVLFAIGADDSSSPLGFDSNELSNEELRLGIWEPGQDVIFVDRIQNKLVLFSERNDVTSSQTKERRKVAGGIAKRTFLGLTSNRRVRANSSKSPSRDARSSNSDWSALGLDCRHRLASHLALDTLLAFDDIMNEVHALNERVGVSRDECLLQTNSPGRSKWTKTCDGVVELCTCMSQGWIYAYADGDRELYSFFDNQIYVTVADVQNAARRTREKLFGEFAP